MIRLVIELMWVVGGAVEVNVTFHLAVVETSISMKFQKCENVTATYKKNWNFQKLGMSDDFLKMQVAKK